MNFNQSLDDMLMDYEAEYYWIEKAINKSQRQWDANKKIISANKDIIRKKKFTLKDYELLFRDLGFIEDDISSLKFTWEIWSIQPVGKIDKKEYVFNSLYDLDLHYK